MSDEKSAPFVPRHELRTPLELTNDMDRALYFAKRGTKALDAMRKGHLVIKLEWLKASSDRMLELKKEFPKMSEADRLSQARSENWELFVRLSESELELQFAEAKLKDLQSELSKTQSESKLVIKEMEMAGR